MPYFDFDFSRYQIASDVSRRNDVVVVDRSDGETKPTSAEHRAEALATMQLAVQFKDRGKADKAKKLFKHAVALVPNHPDILTQYGLFIEEVRKDVVKAEHLYKRALRLSPSHSVAVVARARTQPLVEEIDNRMMTALDRKREIFLGVPHESAAMHRAKREAYFQHVHHTVAIEGNTMTLLQTRHILETRMAVAGKSVIEHNEILGLDAALRFLDHNLVHRAGILTMDDILNIHRRVLGFADPLEAGMFRKTQVYIGDFTPTVPSLVLPEMREFVRWLNSDETLGLHPVELAAIAHYRLVYIHPFIDGNGRTSRLLMNLLLMQAGFPPVIIRVEERLEYYDTLKLANNGDLRPFIRFIARCTDRTLEEYLVQTVEGYATAATADGDGAGSGGPPENYSNLNGTLPRQRNSRNDMGLTADGLSSAADEETSKKAAAVNTGPRKSFSGADVEQDDGRCDDAGRISISTESNLDDLTDGRSAIRLPDFALRSNELSAQSRTLVIPDDASGCAAAHQPRRSTTLGDRFSLVKSARSCRAVVSSRCWLRMVRFQCDAPVA
jgi:fido (protein-threonine AMPylation protein)